MTKHTRNILIIVFAIAALELFSEYKHDSRISLLEEQIINFGPADLEEKL